MSVEKVHVLHSTSPVIIKKHRKYARDGSEWIWGHRWRRIVSFTETDDDKIREARYVWGQASFVEQAHSIFYILQQYSTLTS